MSMLAKPPMVSSTMKTKPCFSDWPKNMCVSQASHLEQNHGNKEGGFSVGVYIYVYMYAYKLLETVEVGKFGIRVARSLDKNVADRAALAGLGIQPLLEHVKRLVVKCRPLLQVMGAVLLQILESVVEDQAHQHDGARAVLDEKVDGARHGGHAAGIQVDIAGRAGNLGRIPGGAVHEAGDTVPEPAVGLGFGRPRRRRRLFPRLEAHLLHAVDALKQLLRAADGQADAGQAPAQGDALHVLRLENDHVQAVAGHLDAAELDVLGLEDVILAVRVLDVAACVSPHGRVQVHQDAVGGEAELLANGSGELVTI